MAQNFERSVRTGAAASCRVDRCAIAVPAALKMCGGKAGHRNMASRRTRCVGAVVGGTWLDTPPSQTKIQPGCYVIPPAGDCHVSCWIRVPRSRPVSLPGPRPLPTPSSSTRALSPVSCLVVDPGNPLAEVNHRETEACFTLSGGRGSHALPGLHRRKRKVIVSTAGNMWPYARAADSSKNPSAGPGSVEVDQVRHPPGWIASATTALA